MARELTEQEVSDYLKTHQEFLLRWLADNTTTEIVEQFAKALRDKGMDGTPPSSGGGMRLPLPTFSQVARNSITSSIFRRYLDGDRTRKVSVKKDRKALKRMTEEELFMELIRDIASELDVNLLCHKILQNVSILTNSDRGSLFLVRGSRDNRHLVSKLFDVTETSTVEDAVHTERNEIKVPFGKGIVGLVAQTGKHINIKNAYEDPRFNQEIDKQTGYRTHSILSMPISNYEGEVIGVAQIINKIDGNHEFTKQDEDLFRKYLIFCGIGITNAQLFEMSVNEFKRNQLLLHMARGIFEEQTNLEKLVQKIMLDAQDLLKCEKCSVYLLEDTLEHDIARFTHAFMSRLGSYSRSTLVMAMQDPANQRDMADAKVLTPQPKPRVPEEVTFSKAFDLCAKDGTVTIPSAMDLATSKTAHIAKYVVITEEPVNVADVAADGRYGEGPFVDGSGCVIKSVLCMPIHNSDKKIIGVTQLINKVNGEPFNDNDVNIIEAFSIFTGLGIHNCQMYENACQLMAKQSVALEVLSYHATAQAEEATTLARAKIPTSDQLRLTAFDFDDMHMGDDGTLKACVRMFIDTDLINHFKVPYEVVCRWVCTVKKNYRPVTYHNWRHAFNVCQTMFTMLYTGELRPLFDDLEVFTLLAACLCHDLDHRGTNNAFQVKVASPLAMLYSTSVLEHHHFDHCIMILNSEGNNIFQSLSPEEYRRAIKLLEHAILSTDLALYFKKRGDFKKLVETGERKFSDQHKRDLLRAMMMTACDVAAITKPWRIQQQIAQLVTAEFFEQGDIERLQLGEQPIPMMDRNKKDELPKMQVGFIDAICTPIYKLLSDQWPKLEPMLNSCLENRKHWEEARRQHESRLQKEVYEATNVRVVAVVGHHLSSRLGVSRASDELFALMTDKLEPMYAGCENNRQKWQEMAKQREAAEQQSASVTETEEKSDKKEPVHNKAVADQTKPDQDKQSTKSDSNDNNSSDNPQNQQTALTSATTATTNNNDDKATPSTTTTSSHSQTASQNQAPSSPEPNSESSQQHQQQPEQPQSSASPSSGERHHPQNVPPVAQSDARDTHSDAQPSKPSSEEPVSRHDSQPISTAFPQPPSAFTAHASGDPPASHPPAGPSHPAASRDLPDGREAARPKPDGRSDISSAPPSRHAADRHQQQNGSVAPKQARSAPSDPAKHKHHLEATGGDRGDKQVRGKRKTLAQAEQAVSEKSGGKSGVCLVS